jgi:hypothetical protein
MFSPKECKLKVKKIIPRYLAEFFFQHPQSFYSNGTAYFFKLKSVMKNQTGRMLMNNPARHVYLK